MSKKVIFSDIQKADIVKKYLSDKMTIKKISLDYGISEIPIKRILREQSVTTRDPSETSRKYTLNENYFDSIDDPKKAYYFGLLMADGYNCERRGAVTLLLVNKDEHILHDFSSDIQSTKPVVTIKHKDKKKNPNDSVFIEFCSRHLSSRLAHLGCMQAKTFKLKFPKRHLKKDLVRHFIRGYFDGDGCISYCYAKRDNYFGNSFLSVITFTSTYDFCMFLKEYFKKEMGIHSTMLCRHPSHHNNNRTLQISGNTQVIRIMKWMYDGADVYLQRKHLKFLELCKILDGRNLIVSKLRSDNGKKVMLKFNEKSEKSEKLLEIS